MAKNANKKKPTQTTTGEHPAPLPLRPDWDQVETDFFARESDLYRIAPVDTFDDLDKE
jgi:hypothetical protein